MYAVRLSRLARSVAVLLPTVLVVGVLAVGCGSSITAVKPRVSTSARAAPTPFCEAVQQSRATTAPVARWGMGQRVPDVADVADRIRAANQQADSLAPQELRADFDRLNGVLDRQLRLLEDSGGDTLALSRDPDLARDVTDPSYTAAQRRVDAYVRRTC